MRRLVLVAVLLVAGGELPHLESRTWVELGCGVALTLGTAVGGWPIVRTLGRRISLIRPIDALASQAGSTVVLLGAAVIGAAVSTTQIVASTVVGGRRRRWRHVRWRVVRVMLLAWLVTVPATAGIAVVASVQGPEASGRDVRPHPSGPPRERRSSVAVGTKGPTHVVRGSIPLGCGNRDRTQQARTRRRPPARLTGDGFEWAVGTV